MKIGLCIETTQADKNAMVYDTLKRVADKYNHEVFNYGVYGVEDNVKLSYPKMAFLIGILLNAKAVDFVVTGCGTGMGAMISPNALPGVQCGFITEPLDAKLIREINMVNAVSMPYSKGFGWGAEINLEYMYELLFRPLDSEFEYVEKFGLVDACIDCKDELTYLKTVSHPKMIDILKNIDQDFLKSVLKGRHFQEYFFANCQDREIGEYIKNVLE